MAQRGRLCSSEPAHKRRRQWVSSELTVSYGLSYDEGGGPAAAASSAGFCTRPLLPRVEYESGRESRVESSRVGLVAGQAPRVESSFMPSRDANAIRCLLARFHRVLCIACVLPTFQRVM